MYELYKTFTFFFFKAFFYSNFCPHLLTKQKATIFKSTASDLSSMRFLPLDGGIMQVHAIKLCIDKAIGES